MGWYYKQNQEPPPCEHVKQPVINRDNDVSVNDIWECDDCGEWFLVDEIDRHSRIFWREFDTHDFNPGRNVEP